MQQESTELNIHLHIFFIILDTSCVDECKHVDHYYDHDDRILLKAGDSSEDGDSIISDGKGLDCYNLSKNFPINIILHA